MSLKYLNLTGLSRVITNLKNWVVSRIPTKTSEITNDSGFLTSHQDLSLYPYKETSANNWEYLNLGDTTTYPTGFDGVTDNGRYHIRATADTQSTPISGNIGGLLIVDHISTEANVSSYGRCTQIFFRLGASATFTIYLRRGYITGGTYTWQAWEILAKTSDIPTKVSELTNDSGYLTAHQAVSNSAPTLAWGTTSTIGTIGGTALTVKMPANPNTDTDTKVTQTVTTGNYYYPFLACATSENTATETNTSRFSKGLEANARYSYIRSANQYNTGCVLGTAPGSELGAGALFFGDYNKETVGYIRGYVYASGRTAVRLQVQNKIADGAYSTDASVVSGYFRLNYDTSGKYIDSDLTWNSNLTPLTDNSTTIGTSSLRWKAVYATTFYGALSGNATNVTGTVAIANGGTGATTRLNAVKALTNENVGADTDYFLTITSGWGKAGYCSVADAKTVLGIGTTSKKLTLIGERETAGTWALTCTTLAPIYFKIVASKTSSSVEFVCGITSSSTCRFVMQANNYDTPQIIYSVVSTSSSGVALWGIGIPTSTSITVEVWARNTQYQKVFNVKAYQ